MLVTISVIRPYLACTSTCVYMYFCKRLWAMLWNTDIYEIEYSEGKITTHYETLWTCLLGALSEGLLGSEWRKSRGKL